VVRIMETTARPDGPEPPRDDQNRQLTRVVGPLGWSVSLYTLRKYGAGGGYWFEFRQGPPPILYLHNAKRSRRPLLPN
jgi:hypothetical protein